MKKLNPESTENKEAIWCTADGASSVACMHSIGHQVWGSAAGRALA